MPYNKRHFFFTLYRLLLWKYIRFFKIKGYKFKIWSNRNVLLNYDSVQCMWLMLNYIIDWEEFNLISTAVKKDDIVFDIGSNIGFYTLWITKFNNCVHAFEPDDENFNRLKKHISINKLEDSVVLNKTGISNKTGTLYFTTGNDVLNHISDVQEENTVAINVITLDEYCNRNNITHIRHLKIDIEGFELSALKGAKELLAKGSIDIIQLEINSAVRNAGSTEKGVIEYLQNAGYNLARFNISSKQLEAIQYSTERENYFAVKDLTRVNSEMI